MFRKKKNQKSSGAPKNGTQGQPDILKKKTAVVSSEAAAISIIIHVVLIVLAGSVVAVKYILKPPAEFAGENIDRPKLERRQLVMPTKVKNLQQQSSRPKVTSRMATVTKQNFSLPDMSNLDIGAGFDRSGGRSVGGMGMAGGLGFGISGVNFFGAKGKGEKVVFVLDASKAMMEDSKGGFLTYEFAKNRIGQMIERMRPTTLFNVMVYTSRKSRARTVMFRNSMVAATPANRDAVKKWLAPLNKDVNNLENLGDLSGRYNEDGSKYETGVTRLPEFMGPIQASMELKADNIFILCKGWGEMRMANEDAKTLRDLEPGGGQETDPEEMAEKRRVADESSAEARRRLEEDNAERKAKGLPPKVISDWRSYVKSLGLPWPNWGSFIVRFSEKELLDHLEAVYKVNYEPENLKEPSIHFVVLVNEDANSDPSENQLKRIAKEFRGSVGIFRGSKNPQELLKQLGEGDVE